MALNELFATKDLVLDSVLCRIDATENPWTTIQHFRDHAPPSHIRRVDWLLTLPGCDDSAHARLAAEALLATALLPTAQLYIDPALDLDRTMDVAHGLLDGLCNPRPVFHTLRCLNTLLHVQRAEWTAVEREENGVRVLSLRAGERTLELLLPEESVEWALRGNRLYHLTEGTVEADVDKALITGPSLVFA